MEDFDPPPPLASLFNLDTFAGPNAVEFVQCRYGIVNESAAGMIMQ